MSNEIDNRVVSLDLENSKFERNADRSIKTLDKLDEALKLKNGAKSIEDVEEAARKTDFKSLIGAADIVTERLSAIGVVGARVLERLTDKAISTGKALVSSLSTDQIAAGYGKYEQKTASVQTLMNSTGKSIDEIEGYLSRLMWFSDETSYSFTDMTSALSSMVSSGGDIDKLVPMLEGMANATAFAGKGAAEFSRVIYNLQQSYSSGSLNLMDWKSVQLAGVNSKQLIEELIRAGKELGTIGSEQGAMIADVTAGSFNDSLSKKWATKEVMERAFGYFDEMTQKAYEMVDEGLVSTASEAYSILSEQYDSVSLRAAKAAQEAKSFTEAIDATKDAVSSGWMRTFETIFGDKTQATELWTGLSESLWSIFASGGEQRNEVLQNALQPAKALKMAVIQAGASASDLEGIVGRLLTESGTVTANLSGFADDTYLFMGKEGDQVKELQMALRDLGKLSDDAVTGVFDKNTYKAVMDYQRSMGEKITGYVKIDTIRSMAGELGKIQGQIGSAATGTEEGLVDAAATADKVEAAIKDLPDKIDDMSEAEIKNTGYTKEQLKAMRAMAKAADKAGLSLKDFIDRAYNEPSGRDNLIEGFWNIWEGFFGDGDEYLGVLGALKDAWAEVFPAATSEQLFNLTKRFLEWTKGMRLSEETLEKVRAAASKVFGVLKTGIKGVTSIGKLGKAGVTMLGRVLKYLWQLEAVQNVVSKFLSGAGGGMSTLTEYFSKGKAKIQEWTDALNNMTAEDFIELLKSIPDRAKSAYKGLKEFFTNIWKNGSAVSWLTQKFQALQTKLTPLTSRLGTIGTKLMEFFKGLDYGKVISLITAAGAIAGILKLVSAFWKLVKLTGSVKDFFDTLTGTLKSLKPNKFVTTMLIMAVAVAMLVRSVTKLAELPAADMWRAVGAIIALAVVLAVLSGAMVAIESLLKKKSILNDSNKFVPVMLALAVGILILAKAAQLITDALGEYATFEQMFLIIGTIAGIGVVLVALTALLSKYGGGFSSAAFSMILIAAAIYLIAKAVQLIQDLNLTNSEKAMWSALAVIVVIVAIMKETKSAKSLSNSFMSVMIGLLAAAGTIWLMIQIIKEIQKLDISGLASKWKEIGIVIGAVLAIFLVLGGISALVKNVGSNALKLAVAAILVIGAMYLMVKLVSKVAEMPLDKMTPALDMVEAIAWAVAGLIVALGFAAKLSDGGKGILKIAFSIFIIGVILAAMVGLTVIISLLLSSGAGDKIWEAIGVIAVLALIIGLLMIAAGVAGMLGEGAGVGVLIAVIVALVVLGGLLIILSAFTWDQIWPALVAIVVVVVVFGALVYALGNLGSDWKPIAAAALVIVAVAACVWVLGEVFAKLAEVAAIDIGAFIAAALAIGIALIVIAGALYFLSDANPAGMIIAAVAMIAVAFAISMLADAFTAMASADPNGIDKALIALGATFGTFAAAALLLEPIEPSMIALAAALDLFGVAVELVGDGVLRAGEGFALFVDGVERLSSVPDNLGNVGSAVKTAISEMNEAIRASKSSYIETGSEIADELKQGLLSVDFQKPFFEKIKAAVESVKTLREDAYKATRGVAIRANQGFSSVKPYSVGTYFAEGFIKGIKDKEDDAYNAGKSLGEKSVEGLQKGTDSHSPSRAANAVGDFVGIGFTNALRDGAKSAVAVASEVGRMTIDALGASVQNADYAYVTPVVDMNQAYSTVGGVSRTWRPVLQPTLDMANIDPEFQSSSENIRNAQKAIVDSNREVLGAISRLQSGIDAFASQEHVTNMYVDGRKMASAMARPMNKELNVIAKRGG